MRTAEEQNKLYQYGRTIPGTWRTNCDGYKVQSNHQEKIDGLGYAIDIGVLVKEKTKKIKKLIVSNEYLKLTEYILFLIQKNTEISVDKNGKNELILEKTPCKRGQIFIVDFG